MFGDWAADEELDSFSIKSCNAFVDSRNGSNPAHTTSAKCMSQFVAKLHHFIRNVRVDYNTTTCRKTTHSQLGQPRTTCVLPLPKSSSALSVCTADVAGAAAAGDVCCFDSLSFTVVAEADDAASAAFALNPNAADQSVAADDVTPKLLPPILCCDCDVALPLTSVLTVLLLLSTAKPPGGGGFREKPLRPNSDRLLSLVSLKKLLAPAP